jgi:hypothetical protein
MAEKGIYWDDEEEPKFGGQPTYGRLAGNDGRIV